MWITAAIVALLWATQSQLYTVHAVVYVCGLRGNRRGMFISLVLGRTSQEAACGPLDSLTNLENFNFFAKFDLITYLKREKN